MKALTIGAGNMVEEMALPRSMPFFLADGTDAAIDLTTTDVFPFFLADGSASDIPLAG